MSETEVAHGAGWALDRVREGYPIRRRGWPNPEPHGSAVVVMLPALPQLGYEPVLLRRFLPCKQETPIQGPWCAIDVYKPSQEDMLAVDWEICERPPVTLVQDGRSIQLDDVGGISGAATTIRTATEDHDIGWAMLAVRGGVEVWRTAWGSPARVFSDGSGVGPRLCARLEPGVARAWVPTHDDLLATDWEAAPSDG